MILWYSGEGMASWLHKISSGNEENYEMGIPNSHGNIAIEQNTSYPSLISRKSIYNRLQRKDRTF